MTIRYPWQYGDPCESRKNIRDFDSSFCAFFACFELSRITLSAHDILARQVANELWYSAIEH